MTFTPPSGQYRKVRITSHQGTTPAVTEANQFDEFDREMRQQRTQDV